MKDTTIEGLIKRFEGDVIYDCHSLSACYNRSDAARKLVRRGIPALVAATLHLINYDPPTEYPEIKNDVRRAWCWLLNDMARSIGLNDDWPQSYDLAQWVEWAKLALTSGHDISDLANRRLRGTLSRMDPGLPMYVIFHGIRQSARGRKPAAHYRGERNPFKALDMAVKDFEALSRRAGAAASS